MCQMPRDKIIYDSEDVIQSPNMENTEISPSSKMSYSLESSRNLKNFNNSEVAVLRKEDSNDLSVQNSSYYVKTPNQLSLDDFEKHKKYLTELLTSVISDSSDVPNIESTIEILCSYNLKGEPLHILDRERCLTILMESLKCEISEDLSEQSDKQIINEKNGFLSSSSINDNSFNKTHLQKNYTSHNIETININDNAIENVEILGRDITTDLLKIDESNIDNTTLTDVGFEIENKSFSDKKLNMERESYNENGYHMENKSPRKGNIPTTNDIIESELEPSVDSSAKGRIIKSPYDHKFNNQNTNVNGFIQNTNACLSDLKINVEKRNISEFTKYNTYAESTSLIDLDDKEQDSPTESLLVWQVENSVPKFNSNNINLAQSGYMGKVEQGRLVRSTIYSTSGTNRNKQKNGIQLCDMRNNTGKAINNIIKDSGTRSQSIALHEPNDLIFQRESRKSLTEIAIQSTESIDSLADKFLDQVLPLNGNKEVEDSFSSRLFLKSAISQPQCQAYKTKLQAAERLQTMENRILFYQRESKKLVAELNDVARKAKIQGEARAMSAELEAAAELEKHKRAIEYKNNVARVDRARELRLNSISDSILKLQSEKQKSAFELRKGLEKNIEDLKSSFQKEKEANYIRVQTSKELTANQKAQNISGISTRIQTVRSKKLANKISYVNDIISMDNKMQSMVQKEKIERMQLEEKISEINSALRQLNHHTSSTSKRKVKYTIKKLHNTSTPS